MTTLTRGEILGAARSRLIPHVERYGIDDRAVTIMAFYEELWDCAPGWQPITEATRYPMEEDMTASVDMKAALQEFVASLDYDLFKAIDDPEEEDSEGWDEVTNRFMDIMIHHTTTEASNG